LEESSYWSVGVCRRTGCLLGWSIHWFCSERPRVWIADNILVVEAFFTVGRTVVFGSDIQDICTLGWAVTGSNPAVAAAPRWIITKPDGLPHYIFMNAMGNFVGCEELALAQRDVLGTLLQTGQDSVLPAEL